MLRPSLGDTFGTHMAATPSTMPGSNAASKAAAPIPTTATVATVATISLLVIPRRPVRRLSLLAVEVIHMIDRIFETAISFMLYLFASKTLHHVLVTGLCFTTVLGRPERLNVRPKARLPCHLFCTAIVPKFHDNLRTLRNQALRSRSPEPETRPK